MEFAVGIFSIAALVSHDFAVELACPHCVGVCSGPATPSASALPATSAGAYVAMGYGRTRKNQKYVGKAALRMFIRVAAYSSIFYP